MSLLNSVLSSINGGQSAPPRSQPLSNAPRPNPAPRNPSSQNVPSKRKAEDVVPDIKPKVAKIDTNASRFETNASLAPPPSRSTTTSPAQKAGLPPPKPAIPYRGSGPAAKAQPPPKLTSVSSSVVKPSTTPISATPSSASGSTKGGYLAVLQRAKQNAEAAKQAGQIKHKPVEKLTKKDRQRMVEEARAAAKGKPLSNKDTKPSLKARGKSAEPVDPKAGASTKDKRKAVEVAYKGTMRSNAPAPPVYRGTMGGPGGAAARKPSTQAQASGRYGYGGRSRYASYSDEEEEDEEEEDDYESESDMEAGVDEMYNEEEQSSRIARREDAEALAEENELKRQKLERKRKLMDLAAKQKKRSY